MAQGVYDVLISKFLDWELMLVGHINVFAQFEKDFAMRSSLPLLL